MTSLVSGGPARPSEPDPVRDGQPIEIGPDRSLTIAHVAAVARDRRAVRLSEAALPAMAASRAVVDEVVSTGATVYGITTGFGDLANARIGPDEVGVLLRSTPRLTTHFWFRHPLDEPQAGVEIRTARSAREGSGAD